MRKELSIMDTNLLITILTCIFTLAGVCVSSWASSKATRNLVTNKLETAQAVTDTKIEELTREVRAHNNFAVRIPVVENDIKTIKDEIKELKKE